MATHDDKRQSIFDATLRLVHEMGLDKTSMSMIMRESGVAMGTIYNLLGNKEDLINALFNHLYDSAAAAVCIEELGDMAPVDGVREFIKRIGRYYLENASAMEFLVKLHYSPSISAESRMRVDDKMMVVLTLIEAGSKGGAFRDLPPKLLLSAAYGALVQVCQTEELGVEGVDWHLDDVVELALSAIKTPCG